MARFEEGRGKGAASGGALRFYVFPGLPAWAKLCRSYGADCGCGGRVAVWMEKANARSETKAPPGGQLYERLGTRQEARTPSRGAPSILVCCCVLLGAQAGMPVLLKCECAERFKDAGPGRLCY
jgi:hypothetical protein